MDANYSTAKTPEKGRIITVQSPGRINLIGEHTDYNDGFVLPAAIDRKTVMRIWKNDTESRVVLTASNLQENFSFDLTGFSRLTGGWQNYPMGVVHELQNMGARLSGFQARFAGDVPIGGGMSSSAALECSLAFALNELFELNFTKSQLMKACQMAEHHFAGIKCGIMDQFASMMGRKDKVILLDCRSLEYSYHPLELGEYRLLLLNTNVSHSLAASAYNTRRAECEEGVYLLRKFFPGITHLRDVSLEQVLSHKDDLPEHVFRRCRHVTSENERVLAAARYLTANNTAALGELMYRSHDSLRDDYEVSCEELDFLVHETADKDFISGSRMMGGGFGGCTISIIRKHETDAFVEQAAEKYRRRFGLDLSAYTVSIEDGTGLTDHS